MATATTKLSHKYQVVIPKQVRERMQLKAGMTVVIHSLDEQHAVLVKHPEDYLQALRGLGKDMWRALGGGTRYIHQERATWDRS